MNDAIFKHIRTHYKTMEGYSSAGMEAGKDETKVYLNANENPYPLPGLEGLNRYPEPQPFALLEAYAQNYGVENNQIVMTRGADEALVTLTKVFCEPHQDQILITPPTFGMYAVDAYAMPSGVLSVPLIKQDGTFILDHAAIIAQATNPDNNVKMVFLCSPNNPTGNSFDHDIIAEICDALEGHCVVILGTLSKSFAFAGMRMGCMLCADTDFIALVKKKALDAYPLPLMSIEAAFHVLSPDIQEIAKDNITKILAERARMEDALKASAHVTHLYPSDANFLLIEMKDAKGFCDFAAANNVIIRDFSSKPETENCLRLSIGTPEENDLVIALLNQFDQ